MPTKKKRVGFIPREDVMRIIDNLSIENNLSISKIISILVEESLSGRGLFDKKRGKVSHSYNINNNHTEYLSNNSVGYVDNPKPLIDTEFRSHLNSSKSTYINELNHEAFDLQTYEKFLSFLKFQEMMDKYNK